MRTVNTALRATQIAVCVSIAFSLTGYFHSVLAGNNLLVSNCLDDGSSGTLRVVAGGSMTGDTIDMSALICSSITLDAASCAITLPYGVTLQGPGADKLTIHGNQCPILKSTSSEKLAINDLTLSDGAAYSATGDAKGGCVYAKGDVFAARSVITHCTASAPNGNAYGGGIFTSGAANLNVTSVTNGNVTANAFGYGGGLYANSLVMTYSTLSGNSATASSKVWEGGGGALVNGDVTITNSTIDSNSSNNGGGIANLLSASSAGTVKITNSTISGNQGGSIGGIDHFCACAIQPIKFYNSTIAFNSASSFIGVGGVSSTGNIYSYSSIFADNHVDGSNNQTMFPEYYDIRLASGATLSGSNNLVMSSNAAPVAGVITVSSDPRLTPLDYHGASASPELLYPRTHGLSISSPAIGAGDNELSLPWDERGDKNGGFPRVSTGGLVDIGAFQRQAADDELFFGGFN